MIELKMGCNYRLQNGGVVIITKSVGLEDIDGMPLLRARGYIVGQEGLRIWLYNGMQCTESGMSVESIDENIVEELPFDSDTFLRANQAAKILGISVKTINRLADDGKLKGFKTQSGKNGRYRFRRNDLEAYCEVQVHGVVTDMEVTEDGKRIIHGVNIVIASVVRGSRALASTSVSKAEEDSRDNTDINII